MPVCVGAGGVVVGVVGGVVVEEETEPPPPPTPMQIARASLAPRPEYAPVSQSVPTQGFQDVSCESVISASMAMSEHSRAAASEP